MPTIPELAAARVQAQTTPIGPDAAHGWLLALRGDPRQDAPLLTEYLRRVNRSVLLSVARLDVLEVMRPVVLDRLAKLDTILAGAPQPLGVEEREVLFLARNLAVEMAHGYELVIAGWPQAPGRLKRPIAPVLLVAMHFASEVLLSSFRSYSRVPTDAWKKLHAIYLHAERNGVATGAADAATQQSLTGAYGETLLIALTDPYRLAPGEVDRIISVLRHLRALPTLGREPPATHASGHFLVAGDLDHPPKSALAAEEDYGGPNWRFFDASPVVERLRDALEELENGRRTPAAFASWSHEEARSLAMRLIRLWDDPPKRAYRRDTASGSVAICVGVKPIAHFVAHDAAGDEEAEARAVRERLTMPLRSLPEDESGKLIPIHEWNVVNLSAGGMKVRRSASTTHPLAVGEVVGIKTPGKELWTIGATRWITALDDGTTEFGVQFFAEAACAVWIKMASPSTPPKLGLLVTSGEDGEAEALLAPPATYGEAAEFELRGEGLRYRARAMEPVERNACFDLFRIEAV